MSQITVDGSAGKIEAYAAELGKRANQSSVLVFHEDPAGTAARFEYEGFEDTRANVGLLCDSALEGGSLEPDRLTVFAVSEAHEKAARDIAKVLGINPRRTSGTVVFVGREGQ